MSPIDVLMTSNKGFNIPNIIIQIDSIWRIPNMMLVSGDISVVTIVIITEIIKSFNPLFIFERDNCEDIPDININKPAKKGSRGIKKSRSFSPESIENKKAIEKKAW